MREGLSTSYTSRTQREKPPEFDPEIAAATGGVFTTRKELGKPRFDVIPGGGAHPTAPKEKRAKTDVTIIANGRERTYFGEDTNKPEPKPRTVSEYDKKIETMVHAYFTAYPGTQMSDLRTKQAANKLNRKEASALKLFEDIQALRKEREQKFGPRISTREPLRSTSTPTTKIDRTKQPPTEQSFSLETLASSYLDSTKPTTEEITEALADERAGFDQKLAETLKPVSPKKTEGLLQTPAVERVTATKRVELPPRPTTQPPTIRRETYATPKTETMRTERTENKEQQKIDAYRTALELREGLVDIKIGGIFGLFKKPIIDLLPNIPVNKQSTDVALKNFLRSNNPMTGLLPEKMTIQELSDKIKDKTQKDYFTEYIEAIKQVRLAAVEIKF